MAPRALFLDDRALDLESHCINAPDGLRDLLGEAGGRAHVKQVDEIARLRLFNQKLIGPPMSSPEAAVHWLGAAQAQDYPAAKWGVGQRTADLDDGGFDALFNAGSILRTHMMRPTWHFVVPADIRWLQALTAPRVHRVNAHYYRKLELDDALLSRTDRLIGEALRGGRHLTRNEVGAMLGAHGIPATGLRLAYILMHAELDAVVCSGPLRGKQFTYALFDERVPESARLSRDEALAELTRRFFTSHGPATVRDFVWWSGLPGSDAKAGLELVGSDLMESEIEGKRYWFAPPSGSVEMVEPIIHLLPNYDEHIIAYQDRDATFAASIRDRVNLYGDALMAHVIVVNGQIIGGWRRTLKRKQVMIETRLIAPLVAEEEAKLHAAAERYGRFLRVAATVNDG